MEERLLLGEGVNHSTFRIPSSPCFRNIPLYPRVAENFSYPLEYKGCSRWLKE